MSVIDTATNTVVDTIPVGDGAVGVAISPDGSRVYVTSANTNSVVVLTSVYQAPNAAPVAGPLFFNNVTIAAGSTLSATVVNNISDPDDDTLTAILVAAPNHGAVDFFSDGHFVYHAPTGYSGTDSFTYKVNDGELDSNVAAVTISNIVANYHTVSSAPIDNLVSVDVGSDGTVAMTTYTGTGSAEDPYQTTVSVQRPGATTPTTATVTGYASGGAQVRVAGCRRHRGDDHLHRDGQRRRSVPEHGDGTAPRCDHPDDCHHHRLPVRQRAGGCRRHRGPGDLHGDGHRGRSVPEHGDGTAPGALARDCRRPAGYTFGSAQLGADGTVAWATYTGTGTAEDPYQSTVTVLRPGVTTPTTATVAGVPSGDVELGADGTVALTTYTGTGRRGGPVPEHGDGTAPRRNHPHHRHRHRLLVRQCAGGCRRHGGADHRLRVGQRGGPVPDHGDGTAPSAIATTMTLAGAPPSGAQVGDDGTVALATYTGTGGSDDPYRTTLTVLRPGEITPTATATVTGYAAGGVQVAADGTAALATYTGTGTTADPYVTLVTVLRPGEETATAFAVVGRPRTGACRWATTAPWPSAPTPGPAPRLIHTRRRSRYCAPVRTNPP